MDNGRLIVARTDTVSMSAAAADKLLHRRNSTAALLYIYILRRGGTYDEVSAVNDLGLDPAILRGAFGVLVEEGLVQNSAPGTAPQPAVQDSPQRLQSDEPPEYTTQDITNKLAVDKTFSALVKEVQKMLGKLLSSDDMIRLFGIYDNLGLPPTVIMLLVTHCIEEDHRRNGPGHMPTMRFIERAAYRWEKEGVTSPELVDAYIRRSNSMHETERAIAEVMQIRGRGLVNTEKEYIHSWLDMGFGPDAVKIAYERTVTRTGSLHWKYMDSIIRSWHSKGLHRPDEIAKGDGRNGGVKAQAVKAASISGASNNSITIDDYERVKRYIESKKKAP